VIFCSEACLCGRHVVEDSTHAAHISKPRLNTHIHAQKTRKQMDRNRKRIKACDTSHHTSYTRRDLAQTHSCIHAQATTRPANFMTPSPSQHISKSPTRHTAGPGKYLRESPSLHFTEEHGSPGRDDLNATCSSSVFGSVAGSSRAASPGDYAMGSLGGFGMRQGGYGTREVRLDFEVEPLWRKSRPGKVLHV
jgi:hypothetical protein